MFQTNSTIDIFTNIPPTIPAGSFWRFWNKEAAPNASWHLPGYYDFGWRSGRAQLGYGDGDEATVTRTNGIPYPVTAYFLKTFYYTNTFYTNALARIRLLRDDGAVVYVNGLEVLRDGMPSGTITHETLAIAAEGPDENTFREFRIVLSNLLAGTNVVAVEVHQANVSSSDMSFDFEMTLSPFNVVMLIPEISIRATREQTSEPLPNALVAPGEFTVFREDPRLDLPLYVHLIYSGSAGSEDYEPLPSTVLFPAGSNAVKIPVMARADRIIEGEEKVRAEIMGTIFTSDYTSPNRGYRSLPPDSAEVTIQDADRYAWPSTIRLGAPVDGSVYAPGSPVPLSAQAVDPDGYFSRIEFYAGTNRIAVAEGGRPASLESPPPPGTPVVFSASWTNAASGAHVITAIGVDSDGARIVSNSHFIKVGPFNERPTIALELINGLTSEIPGQHPPGAFRVRRISGATNEAILFSIQIQGVAQMNSDYEGIASLATIPVGAISKDFYINGLPDTLIEGLETATFTLVEADCGGLTPRCYDISGAQSIDIHIQDGPPQTNRPPSAVIRKPTEGQIFEAGEWIEILAEGFDSDGRVVRMQAGIDNRSIASTNGPVLLTRTNAAPGVHVIRAFARDNAGTGSPAAEVNILVRGTTNEPLPVVSLTAVVSEAREVVPGEPVQRGRYLLTRTGSITNELLVHLRYEGTALADVDYPMLPLTVRFAPGASSTNLLVTPFLDTLVEPVETVVGYLVAPTWLPVPNYTVSPTQNVATVSIIDRTQTNTSSLRMLEPQDGAVFQAGQPIQVAAETIDLLSHIPRVEFYAGTNRIGVSQIDFVQAPPPGTPVVHSIVWSNAPTGSHTLSARMVDSLGNVLISDSRFIKVGPVTERPTIALELVNNLTSELNGETAPGKFRVRRVAGPVDEPVLFSFQIGGLAVNGIDYEPVPSAGTLPIGAMSKEIVVTPLRDSRTEGLETVTFTLNVPGCGVGPYPGCYNISGEGFVDIHIQDGPAYTNWAPSVVINSPGSGVFEEGQRIEIRAEGSDVDGRVVRMEAFIDGHFVGGTNGPVLVTYTNAVPGQQTITVVARDNAGASGFPASVQIAVRPTNGVATITLNEPQEGEVFLRGQRIDIAAEAIDPFGHIARLEFYTGTNRIGVSEIPVSQLPAPGQPVYHSMVWTNAPAGTNRLTARALDSRGNVIVSAPVTIFVEAEGTVPVVGVLFQPDFSTEPWPLADRADGSFQFYRTGSTAQPLMVFFNTGGTATPGADYASFSNYIVFAAGHSQTNRRVNAIDDSLVEPHETVVVELRPPLPGIDSPYPTGYLINPTNIRATVVIVDNDTNIGPSRINIVRPENGASFAVGQPIMVEAVAIDPAGYVPRVEFFSGATRIGVSEKHFIVPPPPGTPITHSILWSNAPAGEHTLVARGLDSSRRIVISPAVQIRVRSRVLLTLDVLDALASETPVNGAINSAMFRIRQVSGPTNEPINVWVTMSGTAKNGIDYQGVNMIISFPTNRTFLDIPISPLQDDLVEGEETVFLTLNAANCGETNGISILPFVPLAGCYGVVGTNMGHAVIFDGTASSNRPPTVAITSPLDGAVFDQGQRVEVHARASDRDGFVSVLQLDMDGMLIGFTNGPAHTVWTNPPVGEHTFVAIATDNLGARRESAPVRILVRETNNVLFARRQLPASYIPEIWFIVRIQVNVPVGTQAWGVEDQPPRGWAVSAISDGGTYDPLMGKVKFGHYVEGGTRTLSYSVRPPLGASGTVEFSGIISLDGRTYPIGGQRTISSVASEYHPADVNRDRRIILAEVTGYAAAWKRGTNWPSGPNPIPAAYVTHAAMIWRQGEAYTFVATNPPPKCWVPAGGSIRALAANSSSAVRTIQNGQDLAVVTLQVQPGAGFGAYTVEEQVPVGWTVMNTSNDGVFDAANRVIRWGLYMDGEPRTLNYALVPATGTSTSAQLIGEVTLDGEAIAFSGDASVIAHGATELSLPATEIGADGSVKFRLAGEAGQVCDLESSSDLVNWTFVTELFLPEGTLEYTDYNADQTSQRYYRLKAR